MSTRTRGSMTRCLTAAFALLTLTGVVWCAVLLARWCHRRVTAELLTLHTSVRAAVGARLEQLRRCANTGDSAVRAAFSGRSGLLMLWALNLVLVAPIVAQVAQPSWRSVTAVAALLSLLATVLDSGISLVVHQTARRVSTRWLVTASVAAVLVLAVGESMVRLLGLSQLALLAGLLVALGVAREAATLLFVETHSVGAPLLAKASAFTAAAWFFTDQVRELGVGLSVSVPLAALCAFTYLVREPVLQPAPV